MPLRFALPRIKMAKKRLLFSPPTVSGKPEVTGEKYSIRVGILRTLTMTCRNSPYKPAEYNFVQHAISQGYSVFFYDRLGTGDSEK